MESPTRENDQLRLFVNREDVFEHPVFDDIEPAIIEKFKTFHAEHPNVLGLFVTFAREVKASGKNHYGISAITERIRWHLDIDKIGTRDEEFKINNNFKSCYARLVMLEFPELTGMFELRSPQ